MTVQSQTSFIGYDGPGSVFAIPFRFLADTDIRITKALADGTSETLVLTTDYTLVGARQQSGGTATLVVALLADERIVIDRGNMQLTQLTDYRANDPFPEEAAEDIADRQIMLLQQGLLDGSSRSLRLSPVDIDGAGTYQGNGNKIGDIADGVSGSDAATVGQVANLISIPTGPFFQSGTGAVARTVQDKLRDTISVLDFMTTTQIADVRAGTGLVDVTTAIQAAMDAATAGVYFPSGVYRIAGNLTASNKSLTLYGDGSTLSIIRQTTTGGIVYSASGAFNFKMPTLNLRGLGLQAGAANCGTAVTMNMTGGSGFAGVGPVWEDVEITPQQAGFYWTKGVRGTNVRNARFARVVIGSNAITGQTTHGFHFDGNDDPVELWFDDFCYLYVLELGILIEGQYEGIYLNGINMTSVRDGIRWDAASPNPVLHVMNSYINCQRVAVDTDLVSYFKIQNNSFSSSGLSTGDFIGVQVRRSSGSQTQASDISNNTFVGGNGYTEYGVRIVSGGSITVHGNTFYTLATPAISFQAGNGLREYANTFPGCAAPAVVKPAAISIANPFPEVLLRANTNGTTQAVPVNITTKLNFGAAPNDNWSYFNTGTARWTPPAGAYAVSAAAYFTTNVAVGDVLNLSIQKNGATECINASYTGKAGELFGNLTCVVMANGTDYFEIFANIEGAGADRTKAGTNALNYWHAFPIG